MGDANLKLIAEAHVDDPLNTWPQHNAYHSRTLLGDWLFDFYCLRCWLEEVATKRLVRKQEEAIKPPELEQTVGLDNLPAKLVRKKPKRGSK